MSINKIYRLALTGGPEGGKSTATALLKALLEDWDFSVIAVGETATELYNEGIKHDKLPVIPFQEVLFDRSVVKEDTAMKIAKILAKKKKVVVLFDRGLMDGKAYMKDKDFEEMIAKRSFSEESILQRYDAVFHLVTTAYGAEEFCSNENNEARTEKLAEKRYLEDRVFNSCWNNHPKRFVFDNSTNFEEKLYRLWICVLEYLENN